MTIFFGHHALHINVNSNPDTIYKFEGPDYDEYSSLLEQFPYSKYQIVVLFTGNSFSLDRFNAVLKLQDFLKKTEGTRRIFSKNDANVIQDFLIDFDSFEAKSSLAFDEIQQIQKVLLHDKNRFLSSDNKSEAMILEVDPRVVVDLERLRIYLSSIKSQLNQLVGIEGRDYHILGEPINGLSLDQQISKDNRVITAVGFGLATIVALYIYRSFVAIFVLGLGPLIGVIWTLGLMQLHGASISLLSSVIPTLLFVLGYTNTVHYTFRYLKRREIANKWRRAYVSLGEVFYANTVSVATTSLSFATLMISSSPFLREFGLFSSLGGVLVYLCGLAFTPFLVVATNLHRRVSLEQIERITTASFHKVTKQVTARYKAIVATGLVGMLVLAAVCSQAKTEFRFSENYSPDSPIVSAIELADDAFGGALSASIHIKDRSSSNADVIAMVKLSQDVAARLTPYIPEGAQEDHLAKVLKLSPNSSRFDYEVRLKNIPPYILSRYVSEKNKTVVINYKVRDIASGVLLKKYDSIKAELKQLEKALDNQYEIRLTGISALAAYSSRIKIAEMSKSLLLAFMIIFIILSLSLRSFILGVIALIPNILPILGAAAILVIAGKTLHFSSLIIFTICLGIAVDDTVHFIFRYRRHLKVGGLESDEALAKTIREIGLVLFATSFILGAGYVAVAFSAVSIISVMGILAVCSIFLALITDLTLLPAMLRYYDDFSRKSYTKALGGSLSIRQ